MKTKYLAFMTLMLCPGRKILRIFLLGLAAYMGVFLFAMNAHAFDKTPPTVDGSIRGDVLRIEAQNGEYAVEAIFINGSRFNFRVDSALIVDLLIFEDSEIITVYAMDFAGNRSNTMMFINPKYVGILQAPEPTPPPVVPPTGGIPVTSQANPFTPDGQATVLDNATDGDEKEFFTFTTPAGNVFFLIVDRQRETDNVYFLNAVTERDLMALAEQSGEPLDDGDIGGIPVSPNPILPIEPPDDEDEEPTEADPPPATGGNNNGTLIFLLFGMAAAGGVGYYVKIVRPKQKATLEGDDYEDEDMEEDLGDEMEFEDDTGDMDDSDPDEYDSDDYDSEDFVSDNSDSDDSDLDNSDSSDYDSDDSDSDEQDEPPQGDYYDLSDEAAEGHGDGREGEGK